MSVNKTHLLFKQAFQSMEQKENPRIDDVDLPPVEIESEPEEVHSPIVFEKPTFKEKKAKRNNIPVFKFKIERNNGSIQKKETIDSEKTNVVNINEILGEKHEEMINKVSKKENNDKKLAPAPSIIYDLPESPTKKTKIKKNRKPAPFITENIDDNINDNAQKISAPLERIAEEIAQKSRTKDVEITKTRGRIEERRANRFKQFQNNTSINENQPLPTYETGRKIIRIVNNDIQDPNNSEKPEKNEKVISRMPEVIIEKRVNPVTTQEPTNLTENRAQKSKIDRRLIEKALLSDSSDLDNLLEPSKESQNSIISPPFLPLEEPITNEEEELSIHSLSSSMIIENLIPNKINSELIAKENTLIIESQHDFNESSRELSSIHKEYESDYEEEDIIIPEIDDDLSLDEKTNETKKPIREILRSMKESKIIIIEEPIANEESSEGINIDETVKEFEIKKAEQAKALAKLNEKRNQKDSLQYIIDKKKEDEQRIENAKKDIAKKELEQKQIEENIRLMEENRKIQEAFLEEQLKKETKRKEEEMKAQEEKQKVELKKKEEEEKMKAIQARIQEMENKNIESKLKLKAIQDDSLYDLESFINNPGLSPSKIKEEAQVHILTMPESQTNSQEFKPQKTVRPRRPQKPVKPVGIKTEEKLIEQPKSVQKEPIIAETKIPKKQFVESESLISLSSEYAQILPIGPSRPDPLSTVIPTLTPETSHNIFLQDNYRITKPLDHIRNIAQKLSLIEVPYKDLTHPVKDWLGFQIPFVPDPDDSQIEQNMSSKFNIDYLTSEIRHL